MGRENLPGRLQCEEEDVHWFGRSARQRLEKDIARQGKPENILLFLLDLLPHLLLPPHPVVEVPRAAAAGRAEPRLWGWNLQPPSHLLTRKGFL